jgi:DNA-directed RNA polymerase subunit RPC12/RpoP
MAPMSRIDELDEPTTCARVTSYGCSRCARSFIAVGEAPVDEELSCPCGGELSPRPLRAGLYELATLHEPPARRHEPPIAEEHDLGYGASHGYDATRGGPTGPGDAPAKPTTGTSTGIAEVVDPPRAS